MIDLNLKERKIIEEMISQGLSLTKISAKLGRSKNCAIQEVRNNGGRQNYNADLAHQNYLKRQTLKSEKLSKPLNDDKIREITECLDAGKNLNQTAILCGISKHTLRRYLENNPKTVTENITKKTSKYNLEMRIIALEFQLSIILERLDNVGNT